MRCFKLVLLKSIAFFLCFLLFSAALIEPVTHSGFCYYHDASLRRRLAGTLDCLYVGASDGVCSFAPKVADESMQVNSYNLSAPMMTWAGKQYMLKKEMGRNPVRLVILEISYNTFSRDFNDGWGDFISLMRLDSFAERLAFFGRYVRLVDLDNVYGKMLNEGISYEVTLGMNFVKTHVLHTAPSPIKEIVDENKGLAAASEPADAFLKLFPTAKKGKDHLDLTMGKKNVETFRDTIQMCRENGVDVVLSVVACSDYFIWTADGWDDISAEWQELAAEVGCPLYDFNLLRSRYETMTDTVSFHDREHMTSAGAKVYTQALCDVLQAVQNGEDVSDLFYPNYAQMIADSPFAADEAPS